MPQASAARTAAIVRAEGLNVTPSRIVPSRSVAIARTVAGSKPGGRTESCSGLATCRRPRRRRPRRPSRPDPSAAGRHDRAAVQDLMLDPRLVGLQLVQVRADGALRAGVGQRVAAAAGAGELGLGGSADSSARRRCVVPVVGLRGAAGGRARRRRGRRARRRRGARVAARRTLTSFSAVPTPIGDRGRAPSPRCATRSSRKRAAPRRGPEAREARDEGACGGGSLGVEVGAGRSIEGGLPCASWSTIPSTLACSTGCRPTCRSSSGPTRRSPRRSRATRRASSSACGRCATRASSARCPRSSTRGAWATRACSSRRALARAAGRRGRRVLGAPRASRTTTSASTTSTSGSR